MNGQFHLLPAAASSMAPRIDALFWFMVVLCGLLALMVFGLIIAFSIRYRRGSNANRERPPAGSRLIEIAWAAIPLVIFIGVFAWSAHDYLDLYRSPEGAMPVFVVAKQWMWKLEHTNGKREIDELHVPVGKPVKLIMTSQDVIHSFSVPAFRMKQDVVPGRYTTIWFSATEGGEFRLFCNEYCGTEHSHMIGRIVAMEPAQFARWLEEGPQTPGLAEQGFRLYRRLGCSGCHEPASTVHAPSLRGLFGRTVHLADGRSVIADEAYIRDSILLPKRDVVAGFDPVMPSFANQVGDDDIAALIAFIRSTGRESP